MATASSIPSTLNCQWCMQPLLNVAPLSNCSQHSICNKCKLNRTTVQSQCPCCWYMNGTEFLSSKNFCSVCYNQFQPNAQMSTCDHAHKRCASCAPGGCILCKFLQLRSWIHCSLDNLPPDLHAIVDVCHNIERAFESTQTELTRQQSSTMDTAMNSTSTQNNTTNQTHDCLICLDDLGATSVTLSVCQHCFHQDCIMKWFESSGKQSCPTCGHIYGINKGPQPSHGQMTMRFLPTPLPGIVPEPYGPNEGPTIEFTYVIPSGIQGPLNPCPGQPYTGTTRVAYLPNTNEGRYVFQLLQRAFNDQHIFTIGKSTTTGRDNVVTWNDIHHKTSFAGGPENFGYPDPTYLLRVRQELADKGYK